MRFFRGYMPLKKGKINKNKSRNKHKKKPEKEQPKLENNGLPHKEEQLYR